VRQARLIIWALCAVALVAIAVFFVTNPSRQEAPTQMITQSFGGPFTLVGSDGKPFGTEQLKGKPYALFFGFTHCPDTCPTTLARLVKLRRQAGGDAAFNIVFVSVDPERDKPADMDAYAKAFGAPIIGLTGSPEQIGKVEKEYGIYAQKVPTGDGDYTMDHTAQVLLFDRDENFVATLAPDEQDKVALDKLKRMTSA
jgi:protein SCO1/2